MPASPPADAVRAQLDRILASPGFVNADRLSRFLRFVVERTLAGEGDQLKEYLLGTEVFDRSVRLRSAARLDRARRGAPAAGQAGGVLRRPRAARPDRDPRRQGQLRGGLRGGPGRRRRPRLPRRRTAPVHARAGRRPPPVVDGAARRRWLAVALAIAAVLVAGSAGTSCRATPPRRRRASRWRCCRSPATTPPPTSSPRRWPTPSPTA